MQVNDIFDATYEDSVTTIFRAAQSGNIELLQQSVGKSFRLSDNKGRTPLHYAVAHTQENSVTFLLQRDEVDVNDRNHFGETALHELIASSNYSTSEDSGQQKILKQLTQVANIDLNAINNEGMTPLHYACQRGILSILKALLDNAKVDSKKTSFDGLNALHYLFEAKSMHDVPEDKIFKCLELLVTHQPKLVHGQDERGLLPFVSAITAKLEKCALYLIRKASQREIVQRAGDYSPISIAAGRGLVAVVHVLINLGVKAEVFDGSDRSMSPLQMACISDISEGNVNYPAVIELLLKNMDKQFLMSKTLENPFNICISTKSWDCLRILIEEMPPFNETFFEEFVFADWLTPLLPASKSTFKESPMNVFIREAVHSHASYELLQLFLKKRPDLPPSQEGLEEELPSIIALGLNTGINENCKRILEVLTAGETTTKLKRSWIPVLLMACDIRIIVWALQNGNFDPEDICIQELLPAMHNRKAAQVNGIFACHLANQCLGTKFSFHQPSLFHRSISSSRLYASITKTQSDPYSLAFLCRKQFRQVMNPEVLSTLPKPLQEYVSGFPDLDVDYCMKLYKECKRPSVR